MKRLINAHEGFTLSELLVVIAIIAILVVISIPVFAGQLESSSEETDIGNLRAAKALGTAMSIEGKDLDGNIIDDKGVSYYFDAASGILTNTEPEGYGQGTESDGGCEDFELVVNPTDKIPQTTYTSLSNVEDGVIQVTINATGTVVLNWKIDTSFKPLAGSKPYAMTKTNRSMIGYKNDFEPTSTFTNSGEEYYFDSIESDAYASYSGVVYIPASVTKIAIDAFDNVSSIKRFEIEEGNTCFKTIEDGQILATADGKTLIKAIKNYSGNGNRSLCTVPSGVEDIGHAFIYNIYINYLVLPDTIKVLHSKSLSGMRALSYVTIPGSVDTIPSNFVSTTATSLTVSINEGVKTIESKAFSAYGITAFAPKSLKNASSDCFYLTKSSGTMSISFLSTKYTRCSSFSRAVSKNK